MSTAKLNHMRKLTFVAFLFLTVVSCTRDSAEKGKTMVRIENASADEFSNVRRGGVTFGTIPPGARGAYKELQEPLYGPGCSFEVNNTPVDIIYGYCASPPPIPYKPGYYTFKISHDLAGGNWYYNIEIIKD